MAANITELFSSGFQVQKDFVPTPVVEKAKDEIMAFEVKNGESDVLLNAIDEPVVTVFVAGYKNEQAICPLSRLPKVKDIVDAAVKDVIERFNPYNLFAYEITVFKKKMGSPELKLHQDSWYHPFILSEKKFEYFSYYIPLTEYDGDSSKLGLVDWTDIDLEKVYNERHIINGSVLDSNSKKPDLNADNLTVKYPNMRAGDCCVFEIRTPHNSLAHVSKQDRYALSIRFGACRPEYEVTQLSRANFVKQLREQGSDAFYWVRRPGKQ